MGTLGKNHAKILECSLREQDKKNEGQAGTATLDHQGETWEIDVEHPRREHGAVSDTHAAGLARGSAAHRKSRTPEK